MDETLESVPAEVAENEQSTPLWIDEIVSNENRKVYLHKTQKHKAEQMFQEGFKAGADLSSTANSVGSTPEEAMSEYRREHKTVDLPDSVVVLHLPQRLFDEVNANKQSTESGAFSMQALFDTKPANINDLLLRYYDKDKGAIVLPKEWVRGYGDLEAINLIKNINYDPNLSDPVKETS